MERKERTTLAKKLNRHSTRADLLAVLTMALFIAALYFDHSALYMATIAFGVASSLFLLVGILKAYKIWVYLGLMGVSFVIAYVMGLITGMPFFGMFIIYFVSKAVLGGILMYLKVHKLME